MAIQTDPLWNAGRVSQRPLDYTTASSGIVGTGHFRAVSFSGAAASIGAGTSGILASLRWVDANRYLVLTRLAMNIEVLSAITAAPVFDAQAYVFRGSTANASGSGSSTLTVTGDNNKDRKTMASSLLSSGEIRTLGTTTALTAATGRTNDSAPFGFAFWGTLFNTSATGTATLVSAGAAVTPGGWQDLYSVNSPYQHPIVLQSNEGVEVETITAGNTTGTVKYAFLWEWAEVAAF